jgi:hypothetical protein
MEVIKSNKFSFLLMGILWLVVIYKAATMSMTHDEASSYVNLHDKNVWGYLFKADVWSNANNHWLNTLLFQGFTAVFGTEEIFVRLANVLSFGIYGYFFIRLASENLTSQLSVLFACVVAIANPYLLDFFSTARGYGLSMAFSVVSLYYFSNFMKEQKSSSLLIGWISLILCVLSLFSSVIFIPTMISGMLLYLVYQNGWKLKNKTVYLSILISAGFTLLTALLTYTPLKALSKNEEFKWGAMNLLDCFQSLVANTGYGKKYAVNEFFTIGFMSCVALIVIIFLVQKMNARENIASKAGIYLSTWTLITLIMAMVAAKLLIGSYYPVDRKTTMFIPFIALLLGYGAEVLINKGIYKNLVIASTVVLCLHFALSLRLHSVREWWYDEDTRDFIQKIDQDSNGPIMIGTHWMFHPSLSFYAITDHAEKIIIAQYNKSIVTDRVYNYYVIFDSEYDQLKSIYDVFYKSPSGRMILKRK